MTEIDRLLADTQHRPFDLPAGDWVYYQEWNKALFLHWKVPAGVLRPLVPRKLHVDTFNGDAYVSLVAFTMQQIRPAHVPAIACMSDFHEINVRTYIDNDRRKGVYFLTIEAGKQVSVSIARLLSGLPYEKATMRRTGNTYQSRNEKKGFYVDTEFDVNEQLTAKTDLDTWLTERYCLYLDRKPDVYRYDIHHREWQIKRVTLKRLTLNYPIGDIRLTNPPDLAHYSDGVNVVAWRRTKIEARS